jgi:hypothetical protein
MVDMALTWEEYGRALRHQAEARRIGTWPISKATGRLGTEWTFVEEFHGPLILAYERAGQLQAQDPTYQYRIWDCR